LSKIKSGPNYTTPAHAFVKATLRLGLQAPFVAHNKKFKEGAASNQSFSVTWSLLLKSNPNRKACPQAKQRGLNDSETGSPASI